MAEGGKRFEGQKLLCIRGERRVFADVSFALEAGNALVLTGRNGAGKSSLLRLMAGLLKPAAGSLFWNGEDITADRILHGSRLHYVGHLDALKPSLTALENLSFWTALATGAAATDPTVVSAARRALDGFGIGHLALLPARLLSAGQLRRVTLARILAWDAPLWLLDEPTTALDRDGQQLFQNAIRRHVGAGGLAVISTHSDLGLGATQTLELSPPARTPEAIPA